MRYSWLVPRLPPWLVNETVAVAVRCSRVTFALIKVQAQARIPYYSWLACQRTCLVTYLGVVVLNSARDEFDHPGCSKSRDIGGAIRQHVSSILGSQLCMRKNDYGWKLHPVIHNPLAVLCFSGEAT